MDSFDNPIFKISISRKDLELTLQSLSMRPYADVARLIHDLLEQAQREATRLTEAREGPQTAET